MEVRRKERGRRRKGRGGHGRKRKGTKGGGEGERSLRREGCRVKNWGVARKGTKVRMKEENEKEERFWEHSLV